MPLDNVGIADARFLNPKAPFPLGFDPARTDPPITFDNRSSDRDMLIHLDFERLFLIQAEKPLGSERSEEKIAQRLEARKEEIAKTIKDQTPIDGLSGAHRHECDASKAKVTPYADFLTVPCVIEFKILANGRPLPLPRELVKYLPEVIEFEIQFYTETEKPVNSRGYIAKVPPGSVFEIREFERETEFTLSPVGLVSFDTDPEIRSIADDGESGVITRDQPYRGTHRSHAAGEARIDVQGNYQNDVDAEASFQFKDSDLGTEDSETRTEVSQYKFRIYSRNGLRTEFGKFTFANPSDGIATREKGEGIRFDFGTAPIRRSLGSPSVGYVVKRESQSPLLDSDRGDRSTAILHWTGIPNLFAERRILTGKNGVVPIFRTFDLLALWGQDQDPADDHTYRTLGGEVFFARRFGDPETKQSKPSYLSGSIAAYASRRSPSTKKPGGKGTSALGTIKWSPDLKVDRSETIAPVTYSLLIGFGTSDDPDTNQNEGYVGETQSFAPDLIFLSSLADPLTLGGVDHLSGGLSNKRYLGLKFTAEVSPLQWLVKQLPLDPDIKGSSTTVSVHNYWLERQFNSNYAGSEVDVEFQLTAPEMVRLSLAFAYLFTGDSMREHLRVSPWLVSLSISVNPDL